MPYLKRAERKPRPASRYKRAAAKYYALPGWRRLRASTLARLPWCAMCLSRTPMTFTKAEEVHHLHPIQKGRDHAQRVALTLDDSNVCPLCRQCHHELHNSHGLPADVDKDFFGTLTRLLHEGADIEELTALAAARRLK